MHTQTLTITKPGAPQPVDARDMTQQDRPVFEAGSEEHLRQVMVGG